MSQSEAASTSYSATRSFLGGRNKSRKMRLLSAGYTVASHQTVSHLTTGCKNVNLTIHATAFKLNPFELYKEAWLSIKFAHPDWRIIWKKKIFVRWPRSGASYCLYNYGAQFKACNRSQMMCMCLTELIFRYQFGLSYWKSCVASSWKLMFEISSVFCSSAPQWRTVTVYVVSVRSPLCDR